MLISETIIYDREPELNCSTKDQKFEEDIISKSFEKLILRCCDVDPSKRPSFKEISEELLKEIDRMIEKEE